MPTAPVLDSATWAALALTLSLIGAVLTVVIWRRRGPAAGVRGAAWTLVPVALWLTGLLRLAVRIVEDVGSWAVRLVFSPVVWLGIVVAGVSALLFVVSGVLRARGVGRRRPAAAAPAPRKQGPAVGAGEPDQNMAEIEAILKRHGI